MKNEKLKTFLLYSVLSFPIGILFMTFLTDLSNSELYYYYCGLCIGVGLGIFQSK